MVGGGFSMWGSCAPREAAWRACWGWWVGGGVGVAICFSCVHVVWCGASPWRYSLGVWFRGGRVVAVRLIGVSVLEVSGCDLLIFLLHVCGKLRLPAWPCVSGFGLSLFITLLGMGLLGRSRLAVCVNNGWWAGPVLVLWV